MKKSYSLFLLSLIIILGFIIRLYRLDSIPSGFFFDESTIAYQSYSILKTGKDTWGNIFPLGAFKDYGEYILPVDVYFQIPFIALFGLNVFSSRILHAIVGSVAILFVFLIARKISNQKIALLSSFFMMISPFAIGWSRFVNEGNLGSLFFLIGLNFLIDFLQNKKKLVLSILFFGLSMLTYPVFTLSIPIFIVIVFIQYRSTVKVKLDKTFLAAVCVLVFFLVWVGYSIFSGAGTNRFKQTTTLVSQEKNRHFK